MDRPEPMAGEGQLLLRVQACGVCHTDLHIVEGDITPSLLPVIPGHQVVGTVAAMGEGVEGWSVGDRAGVPWLHQACGSCPACRRDQENLCPDARFTGFDVDGGFAEFMLADADFALPIPPQLSDEQAAPSLCAGIIGYRSLRLADLQAGERLALIGFGASAHLAIQVARHWGCEVHVFTRSESHRRLARQLGAVWAGGIEDPVSTRVDRAVVFAPAGNLVPEALRLVRAGGTVAINAIHMSRIPEFEYGILYGEKTLRSVTNATRRDGVEYLELAASIPILPTTVKYPLLKANNALRDLKHSAIDGAGVLVP